MTAAEAIRQFLETAQQGKQMLGSGELIPWMKGTPEASFLYNMLAGDPGDPSKYTIGFKNLAQAIKSISERIPEGSGKAALMNKEIRNLWLKYAEQGLEPGAKASLLGKQYGGASIPFLTTIGLPLIAAAATTYGLSKTGIHEKIAKRILERQEKRRKR